MPLYDFLCRSCGHTFEILVMGSDKPVCPRCRSVELEKQMSTFSTRGGTKDQGGGSKCSGCAGGSCATCH